MMDASWPGAGHSGAVQMCQQSLSGVSRTCTEHSCHVICFTAWYTVSAGYTPTESAILAVVSFGISQYLTAEPKTRVLNIAAISALPDPSPLCDLHTTLLELILGILPFQLNRRQVGMRACPEEAVMF